MVYKAGEEVAISGLPATRISLIASNYVLSNIGGLGGDRETYDAMARVTRQIQSEGHSGSREEALLRLMQLRQEAIKGKIGESLSKTTRIYDAAIAYYTVKHQILDAQSQGDDQPYEFPDISLSRSSWLQQARNISNRHEAQSREAQKEQEQIKHQAALDAAAPIDAALEILHPAYRKDVKRLLDQVRDDAKKNQVSDAGRVNYIRQALSAKDDTWFRTSTADRALTVLEEGLRIAEERGGRHLVLIPRKVTQVAEVSAANNSAKPASAEVETAAAPAPAASSTGEGEKATPKAQEEKKTTRLGQTEFPYIDPQLQLVLEQEGFTTGGHNTRRFKAGETTMDGARGEKTNAAIIAFKEKYKGEHQFSTMDENLSEQDIAFIMSKSKAKQQDVTTDLSAVVTKELNEIKATLGSNGAANTMLADNALSDEEKTKLEPQLKELAEAVGRITGGLQGDIRVAVGGLVSAITGAGVADNDAKLPSLAALSTASKPAAER